ncbi:MAG: hypothetical protein ACREI1_02750, partial [Nitrospiraceae bacterium]
VNSMTARLEVARREQPLKNTTLGLQSFQRKLESSYRMARGTGFQGFRQSVVDTVSGDSAAAEDHLRIRLGCPTA